jgi:hypothetical protein
LTIMVMQNDHTVPTGHTFLWSLQRYNCAFITVSELLARVKPRRPTIWDRLMGEPVC